MTRWKLVALLGLIVSMTAAASTRDVPAGITILPLAGITNDRDPNVSHLNLMVDREAVVRGIYMDTVVPGKSASAGRVEPINAHVFWLPSIESAHGVVLGQGQGVKAILLKGTINSRAGRGTLVIKYLTNGLLMTYNECKLALRKQAGWHLINAYNGQPIKQIEVKTWMLGISTLKNVCPAKT